MKKVIKLERTGRGCKHTVPSETVEPKFFLDYS